MGKVSVSRWARQRKAMRDHSRPSLRACAQVAKFGIFSPAVIAGRVVLGDKRLEKLRGKGISYHSQAITEFCKFVGAPMKMKGNLIRKAKTNGDTLGFLV